MDTCRLLLFMVCCQPHSQTALYWAGLIYAVLPCLSTNNFACYHVKCKCLSGHGLSSYVNDCIITAFLYVSDGVPICSESAKAALDDTVEWLKDGGDVAVSCKLLPCYFILSYLCSA